MRISPSATRSCRAFGQRLTRYAGSYESATPPLELVIGGSLKAATEGQPLYTRIPLSATRFQLTGPPGMPAGSISISCSMARW